MGQKWLKEAWIWKDLTFINKDQLSAVLKTRRGKKFYECHDIEMTRFKEKAFYPMPWGSQGYPGIDAVLWT